MSCGALLLKTHYDDGAINIDACKLQASLIQVNISCTLSNDLDFINILFKVFTIGSWIHYGALAIETHFLIRKCTTLTSIRNHSHFHTIFKRHFPYHLIIILHGVGVTIWMLQTKTYGFLGMLLSIHYFIFS